MTRKSGEHFRATFANTEELFRLYYASSTVYTVISPIGDQNSDHRMQSENFTIEPGFLVIVIQFTI